MAPANAPPADRPDVRHGALIRPWRAFTLTGRWSARPSAAFAAAVSPERRSAFASGPPMDFLSALTNSPDAAWPAELNAPVRFNRNPAVSNCVHAGAFNQALTNASAT